MSLAKKKEHEFRKLLFEYQDGVAITGIIAVFHNNGIFEFSDQYTVEVDVFNSAVKRAGLEIDAEHHYRFPNSDLSTGSINLIS